MKGREDKQRNKRIIGLALGNHLTFHPWSYADIGKQYGISRQRVYQIVKKYKKAAEQPDAVKK